MIFHSILNVSWRPTLLFISDKNRIECFRRRPQNLNCRNCLLFPGICFESVTQNKHYGQLALISRFLGKNGEMTFANCERLTSANKHKFTITLLFVFSIVQFDFKLNTIV